MAAAAQSAVVGSSRIGLKMEMKLQPEVLRWARERAGLSDEALALKLRVKPEAVQTWEQTGTLRFTQAEKLANVTHTPLGYLFLAEPPHEQLPIPDFRTAQDLPIQRPSPDLLDTIHTMQRRQAWMRDFLIEEGAEPLPFVASATLQDPPREVASSIRKALGLAGHWARHISSWDGALRWLREKIEEVGILIVINGVVGNDSNRTLNPDEFRGFVLVDEYAPLIFVNGVDAKAAQMFTFAHELAHLWLGVEGVTNVDPMQAQLDSRGPVERFCNAVAAEVVVPEEELKEYWNIAFREANPYQHLARTFKVSEIVVARRALETELISRDDFFDFYAIYSTEERPIKKVKKGGDYWRNQNIRVGKRFGRAVVQAVKEGRLLYQEAYRLTGMSAHTFEEFAHRLGY